MPHQDAKLHEAKCHDDFLAAPQLFTSALQGQPALCRRGADDAHASMHSAGAWEDVGEGVIVGMPWCPTILLRAQPNPRV